jgi:lysophospholipase L1-like esterase
MRPLIHRALAVAVALTALMVPLQALAAPAPGPKVAFFGSSTAYGYGASHRDRRWTSLLCRYLGFSELNMGLPGSTVSAPPEGNASAKPSMLERWRREVLPARPDRVVVMGGANDIYTRLPVGPGTGTFTTHFGLLLDGLLSAFAPKSLVVVTSQPAPDLTRHRAPYDAATFAAATARGVPAIDGTRAFPTALTLSFSADGLHMNDRGHAAFASYMAASLTDLGWAPSAPAATGGSPISAELRPLPGGRLYIDQAAPLSAGELSAIKVAWLGSGSGVVAVMRPDGVGGFRALYRTEAAPVDRGQAVYAVPRWRVLDGDRLAAWSDGPLLGAEATASGTGRAVSYPFGLTVQVGDVPRGLAEPGSRVLAIQAVPR